MTPRIMTIRDRRYVVPTWAEGSRYQGLRKSERFALVDRVLSEIGARVVCLVTNDITVHAWAAGGPDVLHYVYVPPELRGEGLARRVITELFDGYPDHIDVTHPWPRASTRFRYRPHLLHREAA